LLYIILDQCATADESYLARFRNSGFDKQKNFAYQEGIECDTLRSSIPLSVAV